MIKKIKIISFVLIFIGVFIRLYFYISFSYDIKSHNDIINDVFNIDAKDSDKYISNDYSDYLGYISIPKFNINRVIKYGTDSDILDGLYVGIHVLSGSLYGDDMIILAGHNVSLVFSKLHYISIGDEVFINGRNLNRKFAVYDKRFVSEYDIGYLLDNHKDELILITCTEKHGERLFVFLKEVL